MANGLHLMVWPIFKECLVKVELQRYLVAIESSDLSLDQKLFFTLKAFFVFEFMKMGVKATLTELENLYEKVQHTQKFKNLCQNWIDTSQHLKKILEN